MKIGGYGLEMDEMGGNGLEMVGDGENGWRWVNGRKWNGNG